MRKRKSTTSNRFVKGKGKSDKRAKSGRGRDGKSSTSGRGRGDRKPDFGREKAPASRSSKYRDDEKPKKTDKMIGEENIAKNDGSIRLNKYIADAGVCSRREADRLIEGGAIKVNGIVITSLGTKVSVADRVQYGSETLSRESLVYVLLNKPKGYITTMDDPFERKTVMELVKNACKERIYPVGRLDRNTSGLLLFTNDGELTKKLLHPRHKAKKIYHAYLDKQMLKNDLKTIAQGVELEDGFVAVDNVSYDLSTNDKKSIGIEIHSGQNRVVRRIFEKFGYTVEKLDRVMFGPITKKDLPRGKWRYLDAKEINLLKNF